MARTLTQTEFEEMIIELKKEAFDIRRCRGLEEGQRFEAFVENLGDLAYEINVEGIVVYVNPAVERITSRHRALIIGKPFLPLLESKSRKIAIDIFHRTVQGESLECELTFSNGTICHFNNKPLRDRYSNIVGIFGIARDITERKQAEGVLLKSYDDLRKRIEEISGELLAANEAVARESEKQRRTEGALPEIDLLDGSDARSAPDKSLLLRKACSQIEEVADEVA
jgi:PAS domain S-box-containing protein